MLDGLLGAPEALLAHELPGAEPRGMFGVFEDGFRRAEDFVAGREPFADVFPRVGLPAATPFFPARVLRMRTGRELEPAAASWRRLPTVPFLGAFTRRFALGHGA